MLATLIAIVLGSFAVGSVLMAVASRRASADVRRRRWLKLSAYFVIVSVVLGCALLGRWWLVGLASLITVFGARELDDAVARIGDSWRARIWLIWGGYALLSAGMFSTVIAIDPQAVAALYLTVAAFDGFSEVSGHLCGRRPLIPAVSPAKTWEGLWGGALGAIGIAVLLRDLAGLSAAGAAALGAATGLCALAGDLAASWVKRRAGIKDFGTILIGQGGVLDRFDSFIGASGLLAPVLLVALA